MKKITLEELQNYVDSGYLLHGSPTYQKSLDPKQAKDATRKEGNRLGVYLTTNPATAMFCALVGNSESEYHIERNEHGYSKLYFWVNDKNRLAKTGYIYIIKNNYVDLDYGNEKVSLKQIVPEKIYEFKLEDFPWEINS